MFLPGPRQLPPSYLPATTPIPPTSSWKGFQWGAGWTMLLPCNANTLRWSGPEKRPCSSQKSQDTTGGSVGGRTSRRSRSRPFRSSLPRPTTFIPPTPTPPISFSQPSPRPPHLRLRGIASGPHNPGTNLKIEKPPMTPCCRRRTGRTCTSTTRQSSGTKPGGTSGSLQKGPTLFAQQRRLCLSPTSPRRSHNVKSLSPGWWDRSLLGLRETTLSPLCKSPSPSARWTSSPQS